MRLCFHNWSKWSAPIDTMHSFKKVQTRYCLKCNMCRVQNVKQPHNLWFGATAIETTKSIEE